MLSLRRLAVSVTVPAVAGVLVAAQTPAPGVQPPRDTSAQTNRAPAPVPTGKISGRVTAADTGRAVRAARVTLSGNQAGGGGRSASTDENGAFTFTALPDGRYTVNASRTGFVTASYGQRRPLQPGIPLQLTAGAALQNIDIKLPRGSAIAGHVYDENGEPAPATMIQVMRYQFQNGERRLMPAGNAQTNDKGEYRVWGLNPGDYYVSAQVPNIAGLVEGVVGGLGGGRGGRGGAPGAPGGPGGAGGPGGPGGGRGARGGLQIDLNGLTFDATQALGALDVQSILGNFGGLMNTQDGDGAVAYAPTFYPGVTAPGEARAVTVPLGGEALGVDFSLLLVRLSRVTGRAINPDGTAAVAGNATLVAEGQGRGGAFSNYGGRIVREGTFTIGNVPPGRYTLRVRSGGQGPNAADGGRGGRGNPGTNGRGRGAAPAADTAPALFAYQPLTVAGDIPDLTVALAPGATLEGTVTLEVSQAAATTTNGQNSRPPDVTQVRVNAQPVDTSLGASGNSRVNADGTFTIDNVPPGQHWLRAQAPRGLTVKSIVVAGRDVTDIPVDVRSGETMTGVHVTFTDRVSEITGTITDSRSAPVTDFTVLAFPQDPDLWRPQARQIMTARPDQNGKYYLRGLPPGRYYLVTIDPATPGEWFDPAYLDARKDGAARFSLGEGETKTQDFRLPAQ